MPGRRADQGVGDLHVVQPSGQVVAVLALRRRNPVPGCGDRAADGPQQQHQARGGQDSQHDRGGAHRGLGVLAGNSASSRPVVPAASTVTVTCPAVTSSRNRACGQQAVSAATARPRR